MIENRQQLHNEDAFGNSVTFNDLQWDTEYFGVTSAKAVLQDALSKADWINLSEKFNGYQFISIENRHSEPTNARFIGKNTNAYLVDVNIQFSKRIEPLYNIPKTVHIHKAMEPNEKIIQMVDFPYSKFTQDTELAKRGGDGVYRQWIINSFNKANKLFAVSHGEFDEVNGFLLHSYTNETCTIELIQVAKDYSRAGIGTMLIRAVEDEANKYGCSEIRVGTQIRNLNAINFYSRYGFKQVGCHQVFHLWNI